MMTVFKKFVREESGASAAEYALILAVVSGGIIVAAIFLSEEIGAAVAEAGCDILQGTRGTAATAGDAIGGASSQTC